MKKFFKNLAMACLAALSCVAIGLGTGCEAVNSVLGTFESLGGHIGNVIDKVTHECEYNVMKHDADNHWNECECGEKDETSVAAHVYDNACDTTCNVCGAERNVADHVYDNACDTTCNVCGAERKVADHVYDNACDTTCNECGAERKVADHVYDNACDADCNVCGATRTPADHVYDNACDTTCNECGAERAIEHTYDNACDADCNVCGATRTPADHVYDNACDADCNVCGATRTPADHVYDNACDTTCNVCGAERAITHDYSKYVSDETNHWKVCSVCGVKDESTVAAHTGGEATATEQAKCEVCGAPYGETLPYVTAALTLDGDATNVTIPAGKYAQVSVNTMYGTIVLEFSENVTVTVDGEEVENGAVVEYNVRLGTSIVVTPVDATAETVATIKAKTYVDPATILSVGENNVTVNGEQAFVLDIEVGKAYDLTIDYTLYVVAEYSNGVTDSYVVTGYLLKLEEGVSVKLLVSSNDWDSPEASGTITISEHTTHTYVWMKDLNNHWQGCGCGVVVDGTKAAHTYDHECSNTCNVCGSYRFDAADHDYTIAGHDKDGHWMECVCGTRDYSSYEKHYGGEPTADEQAKCEVCGESYGDTLTTAFKDLRIDFPYGLIQLTVPAGKTLDVNLLIEENAYLKITFEGDVTVKFGSRSITSGDVIEVSNFMHTLTVIAKDTTVDTVVKMNADTFVVENGELVLGENEVKVFNCPELKFVFTAEEANTYTITADDTLLLSLKTENGSETVDSGYTFTLEAGASITFIIIPSDWNSQATGKVTIAVKTAEEHTHSYTTLKSDADNHWYECSCGEVKADSKVAHSGGTATCTAQAVCEVCGKAYGELAAHTPAADDGDCTTAVKCTVCDAVVVEAKASHTGGEATCTAQAVCEVCGTAYGDLAAHTPAADDGDCTTAVKCTVCDAVVVEAKASHTGGKATCTAQAVCEVCGKAYGELAAHTPAADDGDCTTAVKCTVCDAVVVEAKESHTGGTATYTKKAVCEVCGTAYGSVKIPTTQAEIVDAAYSLAKDETLTSGKYTLTGVIASVDTAYDSAYGNVTVTIRVEGKEDKPIKCFRLKGEGAELIGVGDIITVTGTLKNFNNTVEFDAGCTLNSYVINEPEYVPTTPEEIVDAAYALEAGNSLAGGPFTLTGVISSVDSAYDSGYKNITVTIKVEGKEDKPIKCFRLKGTGADVIAVGYTITVNGELMNYNGTIEFNGCTLESYEFTDANKVAADAAALKLSATQLTEVGAFIELAATGANGSTIAWALKAECANVSLADGKLTVLSIPTEDVEVVLVATLTLNDATATKELTVIVKAPVQEGHEPQIVATFEFGVNGTASHNDGSAASSYTNTVNGYTLTLDSCTSVYSGARDAKGNSALKLGTAKKTGSFSFTVADDVTSVVIKVAKYKTNTTKINVNGVAYTISTNSNDGLYEAITIDTSTTKTITFATVSGGVRAMIDSISFIA